MNLEPGVIRFDVDDKTIEIDCIDAQLKIEQFQGALDGDRPEFVLDMIKDWFLADFDVQLTTAQAWSVQSNIGFAYTSYKKKLSLMLVSDSGIPLTQPESRMGWWSYLKGFFRSSKRSEKLPIDWDAQISRLIASGQL